MASYLRHIKLLSLRILILLIFLELSRFVFLIINYSNFSSFGFGEILKALFWGVRFDISTLVIYNAVFIVFSILPFQFIENNIYQKVLKYYFLIVNSIVLSANILDSAYFQFTQKRSSADIFSVMGDDFWHLIPQYLADYWFLIFINILFIIGFIFTYPTLRKSNENVKFNLFSFLSFWAYIIIAFVGLRGTTYRPLGITSAAQYTKSQLTPLVLNTPFTIVKTFNKKGLKEVHYFNENELNKIYTPIHPKRNSTFKKKNVVLIILESFGKEYSRLYGNNIGFTPFLDSLTQHSLHFRYSFANGKRSIESLPSIINSIPSLLNTAYISSQFSLNKTFGLANILHQEGYLNSFMHGGANGTMNFDNFCKMSGFDQYYGMNEYPNKNDYDGNWGIFDEPYLQYCVQNISSFEKPFFSVIYTLSSHHPYKIPEKYKNKFPKGEHPILESVAYADYALKRFFDSAKKTDWYKNTLFVITADHSSIALSPYYQKEMGRYAVPIVFFSPSDSTLKGTSNKIVNHMDIMPSILDYLGYAKAYFAFGYSCFDSSRYNFSINYGNSLYYFMQDSFFAIADKNETLSLYRYKTDSLLKNNIINDSLSKKYFQKNNRFMKAFIQSYNKDLIKNQTSIK